MKIGELSQRAGVSTRLLRYYEEQQLLSPQRSSNDYRSYDEDDVVRAERIALLIRSGVPTRLVKVLLDLEAATADATADACPLAVAELLAAELTDLDARITCLTRSRGTIEEFLRRTQHAALLRPAASPGSATR